MTESAFKSGRFKDKRDRHIDKMEQSLILASGSPRRKELLEGAGLQPLIVPAEKEERSPEGGSPRQVAICLALEKALEIERRLEDGKLPEAKGDSFIIGADTIVYLDRIMGKPSDKEEAYRMLRDLSGREHRVITGVALLEAGTGNRRVFAEETRVQFVSYSEAEIRDYVNTEEPYDKAGGYAIQGTFGQYVDRCQGDYNNVIGFPLDRALEELKQMGYTLP